MDFKRDFDAFQGEGGRNSRAIAPDDNDERRKISRKGAFYILFQHPLGKKLKNNAYAIIEISNIINDNVLTTLAWDVAKAVGKVLTFEKEIVIEWESEKKTEKYGFGFDHSYCLIFKNIIR